MRVGAMFAGYGGLELGLRLVFPSAHPVWVCENDSAPSKVLAARFPDAPNLGDVTAIDWHTVEPVDVIAGGSPCQDLSHAGKRAGMMPGTRSGLWAAMTRAIEVLRPQLVIWENVRGALSAEASCDLEPEPGPMGDGSGGPLLRALGRVLGDLAYLGYDAQWTGIRAADVGAPHGRFRVFVLAWPTGAADADGGRREQRQPGVGRLPELDEVHRRADGRLMPTPTGRDRKGDNQRRDDTCLPGAVSQLMPTPTASDSHQQTRVGSDGGPTLTDADPLLPTPTAGATSKSRRAMSASRDNGRRAGGGQSSPPGLEDIGQMLDGVRPPELPADEDLPPATRAVVGTLLPTGPALPVVVSLFTDDVLTPETYKPRERRLLPTSTGQDAKRSGSGVKGETLTDVAARNRRGDMLLPTPDVGRAHAGRPPELRIAQGHQVATGDLVAGGVMGVRPYFGPYTPAVELWGSVLGREAPPPTDGFVRTGLPALSPRFVEWMMGLPAGWVTDVEGIARGPRLAMLGNGVVPHQAAAAIRHLWQQRDAS